MWFKRAIGSLASNAYAGLHCYGSVNDNVDQAYPDCIVTEIAGSSGVMGCNSQHDIEIKDEDGVTQSIGKLTNKRRVYRLRVRAQDTASADGQQLVENILDAIEDAVTSRSMDGQPSITDPVTPSTTLQVRSIEITNRSNIPPDTKARSILYQGSISIAIEFGKTITKSVTQTINSITEDNDV